MEFPHKCVYPRNFAFGHDLTGGTFAAGQCRLRLACRSWSNGIHHLAIADQRRWPVDYRQSPITDPDRSLRVRPHESRGIEVSRSLDISVRDARAKTVLRTVPGQGFGVSGTAWLLQFSQSERMQFFGMGEKSTPFEKSGRLHRFWNTDAWADFQGAQISAGHYDPDYISIPYLIVKNGNAYTGILIDNPHSAFIYVSPKLVKENWASSRALCPPFFYLGAYDGAPSLYIIHGPTLPELTRTFQGLVGRMPAPPLWSLGYHQSRWGYAGVKDLAWLADNFEKHKIPVDGLWLDIDYMEAFRLFTFAGKHFRDPRRDLARIRARGYKVIPIIDPGVKQEPGYPVYDSGRKRGVFCRNPAGGEFVGIVWPGNSVFPDFSLPETRRWWSALVKQFVSNGIDGVWLDMNDPSTSIVDCNQMLFGRGAAPHHAYHNQYATLMARATHEGFLAARPEKRSFIISRSGSTGSQRYCGHWLGDNVSNYHHLRMSIGKTINLSLSGVPLNAPDVGGFFGDASERLLIDWTKAAFLFPFMRNHTATGTRRQEPWAFSAKALRIIRAYIRLRYKLLPYLYNLFVNHEEHGDPVIRPLFYEFADSTKVPMTVDDQFMVGPSIMQAPFVSEDHQRRVVIPAGRWYRADTGEWIGGGRTITVKRSEQGTPLFIRDGSLIPMQRGERTGSANDLRAIELLMVMSPRSRGRAVSTYVCDDGETFRYREGERSRFALEARVSGGALMLSVKTLSRGFGEVSFEPVTVAPFDEVVVTVDGTKRALRPGPRRAASLGARTEWRCWR